MAEKPGNVYLAFYIIACICSFGAVWFVKNLISHAIYDANNMKKK